MFTLQSGMRVKGRKDDQFSGILTTEALGFVARLCRHFDSRRIELLQRRKQRQEEIDKGKMLDFLSETKKIRGGSWTIEPLPQDLQDRRVEITGPVDRKMMINALNSGANVFMADFEDANSPTWNNVLQGQLNLRDAVDGTISYEHPKTGKQYRLKDETATLIVRPRGWHLHEKHVLLDGKPISASLFDFGLFFYHNAGKLVDAGSGPYFYLPKIESHLEARLWNDVFIYAQNDLRIPQGTIKATVLIETIPAAFEMDEILFELREHSAGLNCGRWDYIFSYLKRFRRKPDVILPDRSQVTMTVPFMRAYSLLCIQTCHRRRAPAIGGMAAQIPVKNDPEANEEAFAKVRADKKREAEDGHDGTWVAHPALVPVAKEQFDEHMPEPNQIERKREDVHVTAEDLREIPEGQITEQGLRTNINVGIQYIASWLRGNGAAPINHLMEDAATAEISRAQVWQWIRHPKGVLDDGRKVTEGLFQEIREEELAKIKNGLGQDAFKAGRFEEASSLFSELVSQDEFIEFLTLPGYDCLD
ncbi:MAG TPA: malate synthase A [Bacillales bacterium]